MEILPKAGFKTLAGLAAEQPNALHLPTSPADITGTVWTINLADTTDEQTQREGVEVFGSGLITTLAVSPAHGGGKKKKKNGVKPRAMGLVLTNKIPHLLVKGRV